MSFDSEDYLGSILLAAFNFAPNGYALCNGQSVSISANTALFSLIGTLYGGDGVTTFNLPDFRGRLPFGSQNGTAYPLGSNGTDAITLSILNLPTHTHSVQASLFTVPGSTSANTTTPAGGVFAAGPADNIGGRADEHMAATSVGSMTASGTLFTGSTGGGQPYDKRMPYNTISYCIALVGVYPST